MLTRSHLSHLFSSVILLPRRTSSPTRQDKKLCVCLKRISQHLIPTDGVCQEWPHHWLLEHKLDEDPTIFCVINRTHEAKYARLIEVVHQLAQSVDGPALPYLGFQTLKLERGQILNQHRDYHNQPDYPNHTMKFGQYKGGSLQMLREEAWRSCDKHNVSLSFDALKVIHQVTEVVCGNRCSITLFTPGKLDRLTPKAWDTLSWFGFPVYMYDIDSLQMRTLQVIFTSSL